MQYVRSISGSVSNTWNSINPATLSGAIDVIVTEHGDGTLACSPFHVRFGKFSLLRPHEKKVEFSVNGTKQDYPMKLGEGGEAFFVFETENSVPEALQTSPLVSPVTSPELGAASDPPIIAEPEPLDLENDTAGGPQVGVGREKDEVGRDKDHVGIPIPGADATSRRTQSDTGATAGGLSSSLGERTKPSSPQGTLNKAALPSNLQRHHTDHALPASEFAATARPFVSAGDFSSKQAPSSTTTMNDRASSLPPSKNEEAMTRAINLSKKLWGSNIPSQVTESGDLKLDMTGYKSSDDEALRAEVIARKILSDELEGSYDIGSLIGADEKGTLWIYSSEEAKEQANRKITGALHDLQPLGYNQSTDALSDPGYHSDDARSESDNDLPKNIRHMRHDSDSAVGMSSPPYSPDGRGASAGDPNRNYAKTLRLTSEQLKTLNLRPGQNTMSFTVNRATCTASLWLWRFDVPVVISDIDGTITKSDALGHILNMIGRDWTHLGVAKLYTEIVANGYNIMYLTSRSIGQADTTRSYLSGVVQEGGYKLPKGPVILSPDRTIAALRREVYLRKPEIFKMACLRDIMALFQGHTIASSKALLEGSQADHKPVNLPKLGEEQARLTPFYAGFGNRLTDALSYRSVNIPSTRIFTINSSAEVSLDLLSLNTYKTGYTSMREIVDHFFPPVSLLVKGGGEEYTDFTYWRERTLDITDFSASESEDSDEDVDDEEEDEEEEDDDDLTEDEFGRQVRNRPGRASEDEGGMGDSFVSYTDDEIMRQSLDESILESIEGDVDEEEEEGQEDAEVDEDEETQSVGDYERDIAASMDLDDPQKQAQSELRADLKDLAKVLNSPARK